MRRFLRGLWLVIIFPFRALWWIIGLPFQLGKRVNHFLNQEPSERPIGEVFISLTENKDARVELIQEIEAFRKHILRSVGWLALGIIVSAVFTQHLSQILIEPLRTNSELAAIELTSIEVTESLSVFMRIVLLSGLTLVLPIIAFEFWLFAAPGLKPPAKKKSMLGIPFATLLFIGGVVFSYYILVPSALVAMRLLNDFFGWNTQWTPDSYFRFCTGLLLWMGIGFEFPIIIWILTGLGIVKPDTLKEQWRLAIVIIAVLAAMITPTVDPVTMALVMGPLIVLYFISIGLSYMAYRKKNSESETQVST